MVPIVDGLLLSECCSYGWKANLRGAVEDARKIVAAAGGIEAIRERVEEQERQRKEAAK
jgi:hypothetical protein